MDKLANVLPTVLHRRGLAQHAAGAHTVYRAQEWIVTRLPHLSSFIRVSKVHDGTVCIACTHSVALQECQSVTVELLQYLRTECPLGGVREVRLVRE